MHCYACDEEVVDNELAAHLATFGLEVATMKKTERTIAELSLEHNLNFHLSKAVEEGRVLTPKYGSGYTGMHNLGNSCYMNSVIQTLFSFNEWGCRYATLEHIAVCQNPDPSTCLMCQMTKLAYACNSGEYSVQKWTTPIETEPGVTTDAEEFQDGVKPYMFKNIIGQGDREFSSGRQQDAFEYVMHLLSVVERAETAAGTAATFPGKMFNWK